MTMPLLDAEPYLGALESSPSVLAESGQERKKRIRELIEEELQLVPTLFGRLDLIAGMCDPDIRVTRCPLLHAACTQEELTAIIEREQETLVYNWLAKSWEYRVTDISAYYGRQGKQGRSALATMLHKKSYRRLILPSLTKAHGQDFLGHMPLLLELAMQRL